MVFYSIGAARKGYDGEISAPKPSSLLLVAFWGFRDMPSHAARRRRRILLRNRGECLEVMASWCIIDFKTKHTIWRQIFGVLHCRRPTPQCLPLAPGPVFRALLNIRVWEFCYTQ